MGHRLLTCCRLAGVTCTVCVHTETISSVPFTADDALKIHRQMIQCCKVHAWTTCSILHSASNTLRGSGRLTCHAGVVVGALCAQWTEPPQHHQLAWVALEVRLRPKPRRQPLQLCWLCWLLLLCWLLRGLLLLVVKLLPACCV